MEFFKNIKNLGLYILKVVYIEWFVVFYFCYMLIGVYRWNINVLGFYLEIEKFNNGVW